MFLQVRVSLLAACLVLSASVLRAQEIHILVLNAHNGKPIRNECLNLFLDEWRNGGLLAPTNRDGIIVLHFVNHQVTADPGSSRGCRDGTLGPIPISRSSEADNIFVAGDMNLVCQEYRKVIPGAPITENLPNKRMPSYSVKKILESGVIASNTCGKYRTTAKPGELIVFERPLTLWESLRR